MYMIDKLSKKPQDEPISYDLGWLLQNQQLSDERLCSLLVNETSLEIERLAAYFFRWPADRIAAVNQIIFTVLLRRNTYKSNISGKAWLYRLFFAECIARVPQYMWTRRKGIQQVLKAMDTRFAMEAHFGPFLNFLTEQQRLFAILHYGQTLSEEEIALVLKVDQGRVHADLEQARQSLLAHQRACDDCSTRHSTLAGMETSLREALQAMDTLADIARTDRSGWAEALLARLARENARRGTRQWAARAAEAGLVALVLFISVWATNPNRPIQASIPQPAATNAPTATAVPPARIILFTPPPGSRSVTPDFGSVSLPSEAEIPTPAPVVEDNFADAVLGLVHSSQARWHSLWADVQINTYYMELYTDGTVSQPGQSVRKQIWLTQPGSSRVLSGPSRGSPNLTYAVSGAQISGQDFDSGQIMEGSTTDLIPDVVLRDLFAPGDLRSMGGQFFYMGSETVSGLPAYVLDWVTGGRRIYRYWVDKKYGVILRRHQYGLGNFWPLVSDILVTRIYFDASIPAAIYAPDRYKGYHFAYDFSGNPEITDWKTVMVNWAKPKVEAPAAGAAPRVQIDLSSSQLSFQQVPAGWMQSADGPHLELFANANDLGKVPLAGKSILACRRSPDGHQIAYNSPPLDGSGDTALLVANLASLQSARMALPDGITAGDFAFAPDGRRLAFFGCQQASGFCGLFVLNLLNGKLDRLVPLVYADYIAWSPDGRSIAMVGNDDSSGQGVIFSTKNLITKEMVEILHTWHFQVVDTGSGNVTYKTKFDWSNPSAPPDSPTNHWTSPFKVPGLGVKGCTNPPGEVG
jgi:DNA-directed RNA polymerase specialized sigma24 family protein